MLNIAPVPASILHICMYAAYLARFLLPSSVCIYLNIIVFLHRENGLNNPLIDNWTLSIVLRGIKREKGVAPMPKLPMTLDILSFIHSQLNLRDSKQASFWAICLVSFLGYFGRAIYYPLLLGNFPLPPFLHVLTSLSGVLHF